MDKEQFITRRYPFWRELFLPKLALFFMGVPKNGFGSVDITNKCNLRCKHCYFFADPTKRELDAEEMIGRIREIAKDTGKVWNCTWVGGEPLLRQDVVDKLIHRFRFNKVVTNGTVPLPDWRDGVTFYVSVDGTREVHDQIRGKGTFDKLKENVTNPKNHGKSIRLACCLNRLNKDCIEEMLKEWYPCENVREMIFDFMTPIEGVDDDLWLSFNERDELIDRIIDLKRGRYGRFIGAPETTYLLMKKERRRVSVGNNCLFMQKGFALNASGERKRKCMLGPKADCDRCGCIVPFYIRSLDRKYLLKELLRDTISLLRR